MSKVVEKEKGYLSLGIALFILGLLCTIEALGVWKIPYVPYVFPFPLSTLDRILQLAIGFIIFMLTVKYGGLNERWKYSVNASAYLISVGGAALVAILFWFLPSKFNQPPSVEYWLFAQGCFVGLFLIYAMMLLLFRPARGITNTENIQQRNTERR